MSKGGKKRRAAGRRREQEAWDRAAPGLRQMALAHSRAPGVALTQLLTLLRSLLAVTNVVSLGELIDEHRKVNGLPFLLARAEVNEFRGQFAETLRRDGMPLIHPLTETGWANADTVDPNDFELIARCSAGAGGGGRTFAWRIADRTNDPVFAAYVNHRGLSGQRAYERAHRLAREAVAAGVATSVAPLPKRFSQPLLAPPKP